MSTGGDVIHDGGRRAAPSVRAVIAVGVVLTIAAVVSFQYTFDYLPLVPRVPERLLLDALAAWMLIGSGLVADQLRPDSRIGRLLVLFGILWLVKEVVYLPWTGEPVRLAVERLALGLLAVIFVTFPTGRLRGWERPAAVVWFGWIGAGSVATIVLDQPWPPQCATCPIPPWVVTGHDAWSARIGDIVWIGVAIMSLILSVVLVRRWILATRSGRRQLSPYGFAAGVLLAAAVAIPTTAQLTGQPELSLRWQSHLPNLALMVLPIVVVVELVRSHLSYERLSELRRALRNQVPFGAVQPLLASALNDPSLQLAFETADGYLDVGGDRISPPADGSRTVTPIGTDGSTLLLHDPSVDPQLIEAAGELVDLSLENERLHAQIRAQVREISQSRQRIANAASDERRRIERDLHDGAQQRLVALAMKLDLLRTTSDHTRDGLDELLEQASNESQAALADLRRLARGIHPQLLTDRGLAAAVESLCDRASLPVDVDIPDARFLSHIEQTAYYVIAESLTNTMKHAGARVASIVVAADGARLHVNVRDDGSGDIDPNGPGITGLRDRVAAIGGTLAVASLPQQGSEVSAILPIEATA
jgi:signal transduction histidine kinase